jgi:hypothetical protein
VLADFPNVARGCLSKFSAAVKNFLELFMQTRQTVGRATRYPQCEPGQEHPSPYSSPELGKLIA